MTRTLLIHFNLKLKKVRDYSALYTLLEKLSSSRIICIQDDCFIIRTEKTAALIREIVKDMISPIDTLLIVELASGVQFTHYGMDNDDIGSLTRLLSAQTGVAV